MKRPGHSWPEPGQTCVSLLTLGPGLSLYGHALMLCTVSLAFLRLALAYANGSVCLKNELIDLGAH